MTAEEIRAISIHGPNVELELLREIAAQLAEFNERCAQNCTPPKKERIPFR